MSARALEHNDQLNMFSGERKLGLFGITNVLEQKTDAQNAATQAIAETWIKFPFPPVDCADGATKLAQLQALTRSVQEQIAAGSTDAVGKRYLAAYQQVAAQFQNWLIANKCEKLATDQENQDFYNNLLGSLNTETSAADSKSKIDNWIVFGVLGVLAVGAIIIILKS